MEKEILERANQDKRARYVVRLVRAWGESIIKESQNYLERDIHMHTYSKGSPKLGAFLYLKKEAIPASEMWYSIKIRHCTTQIVK